MTTDLPGDRPRTDLPSPSDEGTVRVRMFAASDAETWVTHTINPRCRCCGQLLPGPGRGRIGLEERA